MIRRKRGSYFSEDDAVKPPLEARTFRKVRFEEVDSLHIVWHGRYPGYLEDGRAAFGDLYGLEYLTMYENDFLAPIAMMHIDYHNSLELAEDFEIIARLHWTESARLNFSYELRKASGNLVATAYTVQLFMNSSKEPLIIRPDYIDRFFNLWEGNKR